MRSSVSLPGVCSDAAGFQVSLAYVLVPEGWATHGSCARGKLAIYDILWQTAILHATNVAEPPETALAEEGIHAWDFSTCKDVIVRDMVLPLDCQYTLQSPHVQGVEVAFLSHGGHPSFATIQ